MSDAQAIDRASHRHVDWASAESSRRVRRRYAADRRLQAYGIIAIALAVGLLGILVTSLVVTGFPAFVQTKVDLAIYVDPAKVDAKDPADGNYRALVREALASFIPADATDKQKTDVAKILTSDAPYIVRDYVVSHPDTIGKTITLPIAVSDPFDQLNKGVIPKEVDALSLEPGPLFRAAAESRRRGRGGRPHEPQARRLCRSRQDRGRAASDRRLRRLGARQSAGLSARCARYGAVRHAGRRRARCHRQARWPPIRA